MSAESVQFAEMVRIEHARIELLKQAADERGEIAENLARALVEGRITQDEYNEFKRELLGV